MSIGVGIFLMVLGAILTFAVEATTPGINVHTLGIILLLTGRRMVVEEPPVEVIEERRLDDGLP
jgi:membrane-bound ClpP family serine protease